MGHREKWGKKGEEPHAAERDITLTREGESEYEKKRGGEEKEERQRE